jgi:hypothetical protein
MKRQKQNNTTDFIKLLDEQTHIGLSNLYNDIQKLAKENVELSQQYTDLTLNLLILKKSGKGRLDQLFLDKNGINTSLDYFIDKQDTLKYGYAEIIKERKNYLILKITQSGISHFNIISKKYNIKVATAIERVNRYMLKRILKSISIVSVSANRTMSKIMKSGIIKTIIFIIIVLTFLILIKLIKV